LFFILNILIFYTNIRSLILKSFKIKPNCACFNP